MGSPLVARRLRRLPHLKVAIRAGESPERGGARFLSADAAALLVISAAVVASFSSVVTVAYAFMDDFVKLASALGHGESLFEHSARLGRPLAGLLSEAAFSLVGDLGELRALRLVAVLGLVALGGLLFGRLRRAGAGPTAALGVSLLVVLLPPFQVYAAWSVLFFVPWAALGAAAASVAATAALETETVRRRATLLAASSALLLVALLAYQPAAMVFWAFVAVDVWAATRPGGQRAWPVARRLLAGQLGVAVVASGVAYAGFRALTAAYGTHSAGRSSLADDPAGKLAWFGEDVLFRAANLHLLTGPHLWAAALVGALVVLGIAAHAARLPARHAPELAAAALVALPLAYLPSLVVEESWASYRTQGGLQTLLALYAAAGVAALLALTRRAASLVGRRAARRGTKARRSALAAGGLAAVLGVCALAGLAAFRNVTGLFAEPQRLELRLMRAQLRPYAGAPVSHVTFVSVEWWQGPGDLVVFDEFGLPSSVQPWVAEPAVYLLLREQGSLAGPLEVTVLPPDAERLPPAEPIVDMRILELVP